MVQGTSSGTVTDVDGTYSLTVPSKETVLTYSFLGYETQEILVGEQTTIDVILNPGAASLSEVVVVGYGTQKKSDLTGAVASVNLETLEQAPNTNIGQFLQGTVPGLNVGVATSAGGTPPISIRGQVSLNGNQNVLIILDGIQYNGSLSSINPNDIASIDVLKDASSTAVYGAQAANGVLLITSKRGKQGSRPRIAFNSQFTIQDPTVSDFVPNDRQGYLDGLREAFYEQAYTEESGYTEPNPDFRIEDVIDPSMLDADGNLLPNDYNWWEAGTQDGTILENNLSISGASEVATYYLSGAIVDQAGYIVGDDFNRKSLRANLEVKPFDWFTVGLVSSGSFVNQDGAEPALATLQRTSPLLVPYNDDGELIFSPTNTLEPNAFIGNLVDDYNRNNYYFANLYTQIDFPFLPGLSYRLNFGNNLRNTKAYFSSVYGAGQTGQATKRDESYYDYTLDNILTFTKAFGRHEIGTTLLYGAIERDFESTFTEGRGFSRLTLSYNDLALATQQFASSDAYQEALNYQMVRVNYKFDERYLITATLRRDGFSGFARNNKTAVFPTLALGWVLSEESFFAGADKVDNLKLRLGYGEIGNQTTRYSSISRLTTGAAYVFGDGGTTRFGQEVNTLGNNDLRWERTIGLNLGIDFSLFNYRTTGSIDMYNNNTNDLLFNVNIPNATGFGQIATNLGQINNKGIEISITQRILSQGDLTWSATGNFSTNRNRIVSLTGQDTNEDGVEDDLITSGLFIGRSVGAIYHYETDGIYRLGEDRLPGFQLGSVRVVDQNGDGNITPEDDRVFLGRREEAYRFSIQNNFNYRGLNFSFLINSVQGGGEGYLGYNAPSLYNDIPNYYREDNSIRWNDFAGIDYWSPNNPDGKYPRNISGSHSIVEPLMYQDRSFIRLQDISLSYNFANSILENLGFGNFNVFVSGKNLITLTKWEGWDPESLEYSTGTARPVGLLAGGRPVLRGVAVGVNITY